MRGGARLYGNIADTNPPLIVFLTWPALWLADLLRVPPTSAFSLYTIAGATTTLLVSIRLLLRIWPNASVELRGLFVATIAFCLMPFVKTDFGQREHLMVLLTLPYILMAAAPDGTRLRRLSAVLMGIAAGLGFALKPHFFIGWALVELFIFVRGRFARAVWLRPEFVAAVITVLMYLGTIAAFFPDYFDILNDVRQLYAGLDSPFSSLVRLPDVAMLVAAATLFASLRLDSTAQRLVSTLFVAGTGLFLAGLLQFKGWGYHMYPGRALMILFFVALFAGVLHSAPSLTTMLRGGVRNISIIAAAGLVATSVRYLEESRNPQGQDLVPPLVALIKERAPRGPVAMLSMRTQIYPAFPAVNDAAVTWPLRFAALWYLPGMYAKELEQPDAERRFRSPQDMAGTERKYFDGVIADLCASPPALLIVEPPIPRAPAGRRSLDLVAYYSQDARFQKLFAAYTPISWMGSFTIYGVDKAKEREASCQ